MIKVIEEGKTYQITENERGERGIKCLNCGRTSYNTEDIRYLYCGNCRGTHVKSKGKTGQDCRR